MKAAVNAKSVQVTDVLTIDVTDPGSTVDEGVLTPIPLGSFVDVASDGPWKISVAWGDGEVDADFYLDVPGTLGSREHKYRNGESADKFVTVTVTDRSGARPAADSFPVFVADTPATVQVRLQTVYRQRESIYSS